MTSKKKNIFILAGESSGDLLGGRLMSEIRHHAPSPIHFTGVGGETMIAAGLNPLFPMKELSVMGFFEVIKHLPQILKRHQNIIDHIKTTKPDLIVSIDIPDTSFRIAKKIKDLSIPHIHYIPPTVWAWREKRAKKIAKLIDHLLCILPFEPPYFEKYGLGCTFVGHMVTELGIENISRETFRKKHNISPDTPLLCMLPGSRVSEIQRMLPVFKETAEMLVKIYPQLQIVLPLAENVKDLALSMLDDFSIPIIAVNSQQEKYEAMRACNVALATSGTVNLELSMAQVPYVIGYKMNPLTAWLAKKVVKVKYMTMTNIILDSPAIPEFFQNDCTPEDLFLSLKYYLSEKEAQEKILEDQRKAISLLKPATGFPSEIAAKKVLIFL